MPPTTITAAPGTTPAPAPKSIFKSKTAIVNALVVLAPLYPPAAAWIQANPQETLLLIGAINIALRAITHGKVFLFGAGADS